MNIQIVSETTQRIQGFTFPCDEKNIQHLCAEYLEVENTIATQIPINSVLGDSQANALLKGKVVSLDELNFLAKRLDSFVDDELNTFYAVATAKNMDQMKDLINLTFNLHCYNLLDDFSDLDKIGKTLYLNEYLSASSDFFNDFDGRKYIEDMIKNDPNPLPSPYGFIYGNSNTPEQVYDGKCFPSYHYDVSPIAISLSTKLDNDFLYLPCEESEIQKSIQRLGCTSLVDVGIAIDSDTLPQNIADIVFQDITDLNQLNEFAKKFKELGINEVNCLSKLVEYTEIKTIAELKTLAECYQEFEMFDNIHSNSDYGRYMICDSGHFDYDENLEDYINFEGYGAQKLMNETGAFTQKGYILYHGYSREMENILSENLGMEVKEELQTSELKLYMPLTITTYYEEDDYGRFHQSDYEGTLSSDELCGYEDELADFIESYSSHIKSDRGLMEYYDKHDTVNAKVKGCHFEFEQMDRDVYGVAMLTLNASLTENELTTIKQYVTGQASDGLGEGLEQQDFELGGRDVNIHLWNSDNDWSLQTAEEMGFAEQKMTMGGMSQ